MDTFIEQIATPLDVARRYVFRGALRVAPLRAVLVRRDTRIALLATLGILFGLTTTIVAPVFMLAVAPAVFGVPHLASDVRYLILRQRLPRSAKWGLATGCALVLATGVLELVQAAGLPWATIQCCAGAAFISIATLAGSRSVAGAGRRALCVVLPAGAYALFSLRDGYTAALIFAHLHNVVAVMIWLVLFRRRARWAVLPAATLGGVVLLLLSGATVGLTDRWGGLSALGIGLSDAANWYAPGVPVYLGAGIALSFVFLQGIHYAAWLGWIPQEQIRGEATLSFRMSARSLLADFGKPGLCVVVVVGAIMVGGSLIDLHGMRDLYLSLAGFHGYLELAMFGFLWTSRRSVLGTELPFDRVNASRA